MPEISTGRPPMAPDIQQQQSPVSTYANKAAAQQGGANQQGDPAMEMVNKGMKDIADTMQKMAQVVSQTKPQLMPILKKIAGGFKEFENQFNAQGQGAGQQPPVGSEPSPAAAEEPAAVGMS